MAIVTSVTMLSLARDALERYANDADAAQTYLSERLLNDAQLREALAWISEGANKSWCSPAGEKTGPGKAAAGRPLASVA